MAASRPDKLTADQRLVLVSLPVIVGAMLLFRIAPPDPSTHIAVLAVSVSAFGLPHGALDVALGRDLLKRHPSLPWLSVFFGGYVALAACVLASWVALPNATLVAFLLLSILHFGLGDSAEGAPGRGLEIVVRGSAPIILPALVNPGETGLVFDQITGAEIWPGILREIGPAIGSAWIAGVVALVLMRLASSNSPRRDTVFLVGELGVIVASSILPVLPAFALYFCALHSVRHLFDVATPGIRRTSLALAALPATAVTVGASLAAFLWWRIPLGIDVAGLRVIFWGLSALTLPHMMLTAMMTRPLVSRSSPDSASQPATAEDGSRKLIAERPRPRARVTATSARPSASPSRSSGVTGVAPIEAPSR